MKSYNCTTVLSSLSEERTHVFHLRMDCSELTLTKEANISLQRGKKKNKSSNMTLISLVSM